MSDSVHQELIQVAREWDQAMTENDADAIGRFMAEDWVIIGSDGRVGTKAEFLSLIRSGDLTHDVMESHEMQFRVYGDTAVLSARGVSGGKWKGQSFREVERVSCVFVRQENAWKCVLTHLSRLAPEGGST